MPIHVVGSRGTPGLPAADTYLNEVFVNGSGVYIGDFSGGYGIEAAGSPAGSDGTMPLGWAHANTGWSTPYPFPGGIFGLFSPYWDFPSDHATASLAYYPFTVGPTLIGRIVADPSGPPGLEAKNACAIDGAGSSGEFAWIGPDASLQVGSFATYDGGWNPTPGQQWTFSVWVRAVPDDNGFIANGFPFGLSIAQYGSQTIGVANLSLTEAWQFLTATFIWPYSTGPAIPSLSFVNLGFTDPWENVVVETHSIPPFGNITTGKQDKLGRVHVKEPHLYTSLLATPRHVAQRF